MIHYKISAQNPNSHFIDIEMRFSMPKRVEIEIQLPAWRPGRYELQNFAKNVQKFEAFDNFGIPLACRKTTKDRWQIINKPIGIGLTKGKTDKYIIVRLTYYANLQNAGSSFVDDNVLYINPVNCLPYIVGHIYEECMLALDIPEHWKVACGLTSPPQPPSPSEGGEIRSELIADNITDYKHQKASQGEQKNPSPTPPSQKDGGVRYYSPTYYQLADSPILASPFLQHDNYVVAETTFNVWFLGNYKPNWEKIKSDFQQFTQKQVAMMGEFPEKEYHFINWILPTPYYHGVEHANSTMIVLGPDSDTDGLYNDLLGVSSHELFHAWNICKIRPVEMLPYDFTKENYFSTGFVAEGVTTYYGDIFLKRSGVFSLETYLNELETILKRHFEQDGKAHQSLVESSFDLWLDGYTQAIPNRRVSIYQKGAVVALLLDLMIRLKTKHEKSLDDVMQLMWQRHGKPFIGYSLQDYKTICEEVYGSSLGSYFEECIVGNVPLEDKLNELFQSFGLHISRNEGGKILLILEDAENENLGKWLEIGQNMA